MQNTITMQCLHIKKTNNNMANETGNEISNMAQQEQEEKDSLISPTSNTFPSNTSS